MNGRRLATWGTIVLGMVGTTPAAAQIFHDDDDGWCLWCFHRYGGDVNRPGWTPDRPYWHGDDAVPLGLRWQDLDAARAEAAAVDAAAAAAASVTATPPRPHGAPRRAHHVPRRPADTCKPVLVRKD